MPDDGILEIHELTRRAFLEGSAELIAPHIGESEIAVNDGHVREETRVAWRERFSALLAATNYERWEDTDTPRHGVSVDGTMAWLIEQVETAGMRDGHSFVTRTVRLTVFDKRVGQWRRVVNASSAVP